LWKWTCRLYSYAAQTQRHLNKHGGQLWNSTMDILSEKWMINRYLECINDSNNVYKIKADAGIKIWSAWHTYYSI